MYRELRELFQKYADQGQIINSVRFNSHETIGGAYHLQSIEIDLELKESCDENTNE